jgi:uncharacterized protein YuzE
MNRESHILRVRSASPPSVEIDHEARAVYVRFKRTPVAHTIERESEMMTITIDIDSKNDVVGVEAVGLTQFSLEKILEQAQVQTPNVDLGRARFSMVPAEA